MLIDCFCSGDVSNQMLVMGLASILLFGEQCTISHPHVCYILAVFVQTARNIDVTRVAPIPKVKLISGRKLDFVAICFISCMYHENLVLASPV